MKQMLGAALALALVAPVTRADEPAQTLHQLFDEAWEWGLAESPLAATAVGDHRYDDRLPSATRADIDRRHEKAKSFLARASAIERSALPPVDQVSLDLFRRQLEGDITEYGFGTWRLSLTAEGGFHSELARMADNMPFATVRDYENYLARLRALPRYFAEQTALLAEGLKAGFTPPRAVFTGFESTITPHLVDDPEKSVFYRPFAKAPSQLPAVERQRLTEEAKRVIREQVVPAYRTFHTFITERYVPGARTTIGASELPRGREYYAFLVRHYTTLELTPEQVHQLGLKEVARIQAEMDAVIRQTGFTGTFAEFLAMLRTDPRFYAKTPEELLKEASYLAKKIDGKLPAFFSRLPRQPYGVEPVPADIAPKYTSGRYVEAPDNSTRPGLYWVNTYALDKRPLYTLPSLTLHEAVPGHHLQTVLTRELTGLPKFRRYLYVNAFGEGWALYTEWLGQEMGLYPDPYTNFGRLTYEMWRACRLVVDTGLHAFGWSRQQALDYLASRTALPIHEVTTETDRYISWPGQALSYKMGELKIRELRARAERALGEKFDLRAFHDAVLANGTLTLDVLETQMDAWIAARK